jgi:ATP-dependent DNA ligase
LRALPADAVIDGEVVAHCSEGLPDFHRLNSRDGGATACLYGFDLLSVAGEDLRGRPLLERRARLAGLLERAPPALIFSEHLVGEQGETMFREACRMGLEGIVSKRADRPYRSGRSRHWLKIKNPSYERRELSGPGALSKPPE